MNQPRHKKRSPFLLTLGILLLLALAATILLPYAVDINNYKGFIVKKAEELLNRRVSIEQIQLHLINEIGIRCIGVTIGDTTGEGNFISANNMLVKFEPIPLLRKELVINKIILDHPQINIERDAEGKFSFQPPEAAQVEEKEVEEDEGIEWSLSRLLIDKIIIRQGQARLMDRAIDEQGLLTQVKGLNLTLKEFELGQPFSLTLTAKLDHGENRTSYIALSAQVAGLGKDMINPAQIRLNAQAKIKDWDLAAFQPYYKEYFPWDNLAGLADIELDYKGNLANDFQLEATVNSKSTTLTYPALFPVSLPFKASRGKVSITLKGNRLDTQIKSFKLDCDRFNINGQLYLTDFLSPRKSISLQATYSPFTIEDGKRYIPYEVIPPKVTDFINNSVSQGKVEALSVKLAGELGRFKELDKPENQALLSASARFKDIKVELADYKFERISGSVNLREGRLTFDELTAGIENSQLKIYNSQISNLYSAPQFEFYLTSDLSLVDGYLRRSLSPDLTKRFNLQGQASLRLEVKGNSPKLALNGSVELTQASYSYGLRLKKEAGQRNALAFEAQLLEWKAFDLQRFTYSLDTSQILVNVEELKPVKLDLQTDRFDIKELKLLMPSIFTPDTKGFIMLKAKVAQAPAGMSINGNMVVQQSQLQLLEYSPKLEGESRFQFDISAKPKGLQIGGQAELTQAAYSYRNWLNKPLGLKNSVAFQGMLKDAGGFKLERLLISLDSSQLLAQGGIADLKSTEAQLKLTGEKIELDHLIPVFPNLLPNKLKLAQGYLKLTLNLTGPLNDPSQLGVQGVVQVHNTSLTGDDPPYQLDNLSARLTPLDNSSLALDLQTEQGSYKKFKFSKATGRVRLDKSHLLVNTISLDAYQGSLFLKGRLKFSPLSYDLSFEAEKMDIKQLTHELKLSEGVISGRITAEGHLSDTGKGEKFTGLNGVLKLSLADGEIKKYSTLAKIFSLTSPAVLFRPPDLSAEGFPYQSIQGSFNIANGVATTENLVLASDAWKIVTLGKIDLVNRELDLKVYVQPWQTLDKIISHIPIAGRILKGKNRGMLDIYFTVKGGFDSPEVTAKPLTSLAENIWGIFRRTITLPFTIFSD